LDLSQRRETELRCDNQMLRQTVLTLSAKIEELVKCFELLQFEDAEQNHSKSPNSIPIPADYGVPLLTSTPSKDQQQWERKRSGGDNECMGTPNASSTPRTGNNAAQSRGYFEASSPRGQPGTSFSSIMNSIHDLNNSHEKRLDNVEELMEQLKTCMGRRKN